MVKEGKKLSEHEIKEQIKAIAEGKYPEEALAVLGENRGQLFVRIPKVVVNRLKLKKGNEIMFKVSNEKGKPVCEIQLWK